MIELFNVCKKYKNEYALKDVTLSLPRYGLVAIKGPSGCGKTTMLNCIAGLISYEGSIKIDNKPLDFKSDKDTSNYRLSNIGFVFQDFRLFENETVIENILFPLETLTNLDTKRKEIKCRELLKLVDLKGKEKQYVSTLSGGEKQRVCIARSLVNDPKIILADEPTGALDENNSKQIMRTLEKVSSNALVIFVTHDDGLAKEFGDLIIEMKDGKIVSNIANNHHDHNAYIPILKNGDSNKKPRISQLFLVKHSLRAMRRKKIRSLICTAITSLGLIGVGVAASISTFISTNIQEAYSTLIKKDQIMVSLKNNDKTKFGEYAGSYYEAMSIAEKYNKYIEGVGVIYYADFESFFPESNELCIANTIYHSPIRGFTARNINEYEWLTQCHNEFYPFKPEYLNDDEICLGLNAQTIYDICYLLRIERSIESFSSYLENNNLDLVFNFENISWQYSDQQIVTLKAFCLENNLKIYHTNNLWNEYMLETRMRFPSSDAISEQDYYPWVMKRVPYLYCNEQRDEFLTYSIEDSKLQSYLFEVGNTKYFPVLYKTADVVDRNRILFFSNTIDSIPLNYLEYFYSADKNLQYPLLGGSSGYVIYPGSLMMGFSDTFLASYNLDQLNTAIDIETNTLLSNDQTIKLPDDIIEGHFTKTMQNGLNFNVCPQELLIGHSPENLDEIVVSKSLYFLNEEASLDSHLFVSFPSSSSINSRGEITKDFKIVKLKVVGVTNDTGYSIYHNYMWPILFFQTRIGLSAFHLKTKTISFSLKNSDEMKTSLERLKKGFPQYDIINPLTDINKSVNELCGYVSIISILLSLIASITSILLLSICIYLHIFESRKEIGLARCIGINKKEANKFVYMHSITLCAISLISSSIELSLVSFIISFELTGKLTFIVDPLSYFLMTVLALLISLFSSFVISTSINKNNPIDALKY